MKTKICVLGILLAVNVPAWASLYSFGTLDAGSPLGTIPDNNTLGTGSWSLSSQANLSFTPTGLGSSLSDLTLTFELQGGTATDLSGYLRLGNTTGSPYYNLTSLIQSQTLSAGSPTTITLDFNTPTYGSDFSTSFHSQNPNNTWTIFFADTVPGDTTLLNGWSLDITVVPETVNVALGIFAAGFIGVGAVRACRHSKKAALPSSALTA